jgi:ribosomal protein L11 methylase PrmA
VCIDVGCGSGRDLVWLALQLGPGWEVVGLDNHTKALQRALMLAESEGVSDRVRCTPALRPRSGFRLPAALVESSRVVATPQAARGWSRPPCTSRNCLVTAVHCVDVPKQSPFDRLKLLR